MSGLFNYIVIAILMYSVIHACKATHYIISIFRNDIMDTKFRLGLKNLKRHFNQL